MNKTIVIYHRADYDGIFCREIARKFLPEAELIGWDYGDPIISRSRLYEGQIYILDLNPECFGDWPPLPPADLERIIWIDHHKSAIDKFPACIPGYRIDGVAACRLAWQWFTTIANSTPSGILIPKQDFIDRKVAEPLAVRLAGEYDIWDKRDPDAELFQHGLRSRPIDDYWWKQMLDIGKTADDLVGVLLESGRAIQYDQTEQNASIINAFGFDVDFEGLHFLACNHARFNSHLFTAGIKPKHDALMGFNWDGPKREWRVSLYHAPRNEQHDLSLIAVKYGGGGHRSACGFRVKELPFLK